MTGGANGGLFYLVTEYGANIWNTGPEYQVVDNARHPDGASAMTSYGSIFEWAPATVEPNPPGQWNTLKIEVNNDTYKHYMNGALTASATRAELMAKIGDTKFAEFADHFALSPGALGLQHHGEGGIKYKNFKITPL